MNDHQVFRLIGIFTIVAYFFVSWSIVHLSRRASANLKRRAALWQQQQKK